MKIKQSKWWDMDITAQELIDSNEKCWLELNCNPHKYDDGETNVRIFVKHPNYSEERKQKEHNDHIEISIDREGLVYDGDAFIDKTNMQYVDIKIGIIALIDSIRKEYSEFNLNEWEL